jgi:uncharacterized OsmC-like protein
MPSEPEYPDHIAVVDVATVSHRHMRVEAFARGQASILADEPLGFDIGEPPVLRGQSRGWSPVHYQLAALATCTSVTVKVVAAGLGFAVEGLRTAGRSLIDLRGFADGDRTRSPALEQITLELTLDTPEPDARIAELAEETHRACPQLVVYHRAQVPMLFRWLRPDGAVAVEQRFHLPAGGPAPAETLALAPAEAS